MKNSSKDIGAQTRGSEPLDEEEAAEIDQEDGEELRQDELRHSAADLLLVEQARAWLLGEGD